MTVQDQDPQPSTRQAQPDPSRSSRDADQRSGEDRHLTTAEMMIGTTMMFTGFLSVLMSISGGFEISVFPLILYFAGLAIWAHATIVNPTVRYTVITMAIVLGLAFFHYGEVYFWHKQVIFWATVAIVVFFMFKTSPK
jgi:cation transport ATPase